MNLFNQDVMSNIFNYARWNPILIFSLEIHQILPRQQIIYVDLFLN